MELEIQEKLERVSQAVDQMAIMGYRLEELLEGFKLYNKYKGTLEIDLYEQSLDVFESAIEAMEEQLKYYHKLFNEVKSIVK